MIKIDLSCIWVDFCAKKKGAYRSHKKKEKRSKSNIKEGGFYDI